MKSLLAAVLTISLTTAPILAGHCHVQQVVAQEYVAPVYQQQVTVAAFLAVPVVAYPIVGAAYAPAVTAPVVAAPAAVQAEAPLDAAALAKEITALRAELAALKSAQQTASLTGVGVLQSRCAGCHGSAAEEKGGGFRLVDDAGKPAILSLVEQRRVKNRVNAGTMPPPKAGSLNDTERNVLLETLTKPMNSASN